MRIFSRTPAPAPAPADQPLALQQPALGRDALKAIFRTMPEAALAKELAASLAVVHSRDMAITHGEKGSRANQTLIAMAQLLNEAVHVIDGKQVKLRQPTAVAAGASDFVKFRKYVANMPIYGQSFPSMPAEPRAKPASAPRAASRNVVRFDAPQAAAVAAPKPLKGILKRPAR